MRTFLQGIYSRGPSSQTEKLQQLRERIHGYRSSFTERATAIIHSLQSHTDLTCRTLAMRLSFSEYYKTKREMQHKS